MPNWCHNRITITGNDAELNKFMQAVTITPDPENLDSTNARILQQLIPMPTILEGTTSPTPSSPDPNENWLIWLKNGEITQKRYDELVDETRTRYEQGKAALEATGYSNWWDWQCENWGVKWGDSDAQLLYDDGVITGTFMTPWGPAVEGFTKIAEMFPSLHIDIDWQEEGGYEGTVTYRGGELIGTQEAEWGEIFPDKEEGYFSFCLSDFSE